MKKLVLVSMVFFLAAIGVFGFEVLVPNEVPSYKDLEVILKMEEGVAVAQARFYFLEEGNGDPLYVEFILTDGVWSALVPMDYLRGEELVYHTQVQTTAKKFIRSPEMGERKARLIKDTTPPKLLLKSPEKNELVKGKEQLIVFQLIEESAIDDLEVTYDGVPLQ
ncbi:MAG: hypothetical protein CVV53_09960, partial [Spirochaetae bacterium HGW-Spirochaetae-9]